MTDNNTRIQLNNNQSLHIDSSWPALPYEDFKATAYLLQRGLQAIGKLKLATPHEPQWANVVLYVTATGLTTGPIPCGHAAFGIDVDFITHQVICTTSWGQRTSFKLQAMSVAQFVKCLFHLLHSMGVAATISHKPQEVADPVIFQDDIEQRPYDANLANAWWRILLSSQQVMQQYRAKFTGKTPPIGFMWGTFDLRDVRFNGDPVVVPKTGPMSGYLRRNAMDAAQVEAGWWSGNPDYPKPAYYSFTYPQPAGIEQAKIKPNAAHWDPKLQEFILDYDAMRESANPAAELLAFLESTYQAAVDYANWDSKLVGSGQPA